MMAVVAAGKLHRSVVRSTRLVWPSGTWRRATSSRCRRAPRRSGDDGGLAANSQTRFLTFHPYGVALETVDAGLLQQLPRRERLHRRQADLRQPQPGVWELLVESRRTSPLLDNPFTLTASVVGVRVDPASQTVPSGLPGRSR